ncbi:hypothetical protein MKZ38_008499 [Zalerion maritima]|uniref:Uncharacterized protein n=1 Tax=Zalerion maritima TaxID=339359 RepID=A0AAD5WMF3_9PEZI|nr:hypothetical protein MKZ38_008499 [Zalerion maritima]
MTTYSVQQLRPGFEVEIAHEGVYKPDQQLWETVVAYLCEQPVLSRIVSRVVIRSFLDPNTQDYGTWHSTKTDGLHITVKLMLPNTENDWCIGNKNIRDHPRISGRGLDDEADRIQAARVRALVERRASGEPNEHALLSVKHLRWGELGKLLKKGEIKISEPAPQTLPKDSGMSPSRSSAPSTRGPISPNKSAAIGMSWRTPIQLPPAVGRPASTKISNNNNNNNNTSSQGPRPGNSTTRRHRPTHSAAGASKSSDWRRKTPADTSTNNGNGTKPDAWRSRTIAAMQTKSCLGAGGVLSAFHG